MRKELVLLTGMALAGCTAPAYKAYTTPWGIYYKDKNPSKQIIKHEEQHWEDYMNDPLFFLWYNISPEYACTAEIRANEAAEIYPADQHPACIKEVQ